ncbi:MAG: pyruvate kinase [Haloquadratum walsbyi J07HQW1]|jgi:pyruvate kinase (EC 2.7.1.40)|uniref:Pyruvate kinase n=1 Tax=Haloquadratum walsbyi J07HQW1 TaxID=1238424 RepID=U1PBE7_9EURY|nr:MAG: pyruvate kinase [Haloquadratum walsbyi J07HQW1]
MRNAKIVCTLGPASDEQSTIRALVDAGMSVARLNASHGTPDHRRSVINRIRNVDRVTEKPVAAMVDLQGPEVRTAPVSESVSIESESEIRFTTDDEITSEVIGLSYSIDTVDPGDTVLLDDGRIETTVQRVDSNDVIAHVDSGGELGGRKGVNVPGVDLDIDLLTESDHEDLRVAAETNADFVAASFVRSAADVYTISDALDALGGDIPVVAKIERAGAVENLDEIIDAAYGVMVARGDLGVEMPLEEVPVIQKRIITRCHDTGTPVITATEMLDSMVQARRPTRAEASDVANAVLDGTDAVMLSGETAIGDNPVRVVETMDRIVRQIESSAEYSATERKHVPTAAEDSRTEALARSARYLARDVGASAIVAVSESGYTARKTAKFRPGVPVVAITPNDRVRRQLTLSWGVTSTYSGSHEDIEGLMEDAVDAALDANVASSGDTIVVLSGMMTELEGTNTTNMLKVHVAAETIATGRKVVGGRAAGPLATTTNGRLDEIPDGAILALPADFDDEFECDATMLRGIIDARPGMTGYPAVIARELDIPMISGAPLPPEISDGTALTIHAERGIVYEGDLTRPHDQDRNS